MKREVFLELEGYMHGCMTDSAHDREHVYRVLYTALELAKGEPDTDLDVLIAACLLHDIGRQAQLADPTVCHAREGAKMARAYLLGKGFSEEYAEKVSHCIEAHRFRKNNPPVTTEAKLLFDADKLDVTGAIGIARSLMYKADMAEPLYHVLPGGKIADGTEDLGPSFFREYKFKLEKLYDKFYTVRGAELARDRQRIAADFYESLYREVNTGYTEGRQMLGQCLEETR